MRTTLITWVIFALCIAIVPVTAQGDDMTMAYVRFAHFAPDADALDVSINGATGDLESLSYLDVSDWIAVEAGELGPTIASTGETVIDPDPIELAAGQWVTVAIVGSAEDGTLRAFPVEELFTDTVPGVANVTFFNGLTQDTQINFIRDGEPFVVELGPAGAASDLLSVNSFKIDSGVYDWSVTPTYEPDTLFGDEPDTDITETSSYLLAVVGAADPEFLVIETDRVVYNMLTGALQEPGTILEAAQAVEMLAPFAQALEDSGLAEELSSEGPYTVFAPVDFAMDAIQMSNADADAVADYLRGFIVAGDLQSQEVFKSGTLAALDGSELTITTDGNTAYINGAQILKVNIPATNGVIHIIGLLPGQG